MLLWKKGITKRENKHFFIDSHHRKKHNMATTLRSFYTVNNKRCICSSCACWHSANQNEKAPDEDSPRHLRRGEQRRRESKREGERTRKQTTWRSIERVGEENKKAYMRCKHLKVKWQSIGEEKYKSSAHIWMRLRERGRENKKRGEIAQLVLHPSSVWIGCQLDSGNIHWLIFSTGRRMQSDVGWPSQLSSELFQIYYSLQTAKWCWWKCFWGPEPGFFRSVVYCSPPLWQLRRVFCLRLLAKHTWWVWFLVSQALKACGPCICTANRRNRGVSRALDSLTEWGEGWGSAVLSHAGRRGWPLLSKNVTLPLKMAQHISLILCAFPVSQTLSRTEARAHICTVSGFWVIFQRRAAAVAAAEQRGRALGVTLGVGRRDLFALCCHCLVLRRGAWTSRYCVWHLCANGTTTCHTLHNYVNMGFQRSFGHLCWAGLWRVGWGLELDKQK